jgi:oligopeptide transport system substrate-binding protein
MSRYRLCGIGGLVIFLLAACGSPSPAPATPVSTELSSTSTPTPAPEPVLVRIDLGLPPASIDPLRVGPREASANDLVENLFVGLTRLDGDSGEVEPALAKSWETSSDGLTWTFSLRDDLSWVSIDQETGQVTRKRLITAADVVYTVQRVCRASTSESLASAAFVIKGCREIGEQNPDSLTDEIVERTVGVRVLNDTTVEFKLTSDAAYFPSLLAMPLLRPVPSEIVDAEEDQWTQPGKVWTSGPYAVQPNIPPEEGYTLIANSFWPLARSGNVDIVQISFSQDASQPFTAWQSGDLALVTLPADEIAKVSFEDDPAYRLLAQPAATFVVANYDTPPLDNIDVRWALSLAVDRQKLIDKVLEPADTTALPALDIVPPGSAGAPAYGEVGVAPDLDAARARLADAGYRGCVHLPRITLLVDDSTLSQLVGDQLIETWTEVFGCPAGVFELEQQSLNDVETLLRQPAAIRQPRRPGLILLNWQANYSDAYHWQADIFACREEFPDAFANQSRACVEGELGLTQAITTLDPQLRAGSYRHVEEAFFGPDGEMPVVPLYFYSRAIAIQPWIDIYPLHAGPLRFEEWVVASDHLPS